MEATDLMELVKAAKTLKLASLTKIRITDVKRSFHQEVKVTHPDKVGGSFEAFNSVMHAYKTLLRYFEAKGSDTCNAKTDNRTFSQQILKSDMMFVESDLTYFYQCRCGELMEIPSVAISLDMRFFTCATCSLGYQLINDCII